MKEVLMIEEYNEKAFENIKHFDEFGLEEYFVLMS